MNKTLPTARLCDTEAEKKAKAVRGSKIRPINAGTSYDVPGRLRKLVHEMENDKWGRVTDVAIVFRYIDPKDGICSHSLCHGVSGIQDFHYMLSRALAKLE